MDKYDPPVSEPTDKTEPFVIWKPFGRGYIALGLLQLKMESSSLKQFMGANFVKPEVIEGVI